MTDCWYYGLTLSPIYFVSERLDVAALTSPFLPLTHTHRLRKVKGAHAHAVRHTAVLETWARHVFYCQRESGLEGRGRASQVHCRRRPERERVGGLTSVGGDSIEGDLDSWTQDIGKHSVKSLI